MLHEFPSGTRQRTSTATSENWALVGAGVHDGRASDGAGNAAGELVACKPGIPRHGGHGGVRGPGRCPHEAAGQHLDVREIIRQQKRHAVKSLVGREHVGAESQHTPGNPARPRKSTRRPPPRLRSAASRAIAPAPQCEMSYARPGARQDAHSANRRYPEGSSRSPGRSRLAPPQLDYGCRGGAGCPDRASSAANRTGLNVLFCRAEDCLSESGRPAPSGRQKSFKPVCSGPVSSVYHAVPGYRW